MSKLINYPKFSPLPPFTDAANVPENIQNWINRSKDDKLKLYCRPTDSDLGYRFVCEEDFLETVEEEQVILRCKVKVIFTRYAEVRDRAWCPLHFTTRFIKVEVYYNERIHQYKNDNQLRLFLKNNDK